MNLPAKTIVLGANGLLGAGLVDALVAMGVSPVCVDLASEPRARTTDGAGSEGNALSYFECDICNEAAMIDLVGRVRAEHPEARAVVNLTYPRLPSFGKPPAEQDCAGFTQNLALHGAATFNVFKHFGAHFAASGFGKIISFSSVYGFFLPRPDLYAGTSMTISAEYVACKAAIIQLNMYYAKMFRDKGVRYNCVSPGGVFDNQNPAFVDRYGRHTLTGGLLPVESVVAAVLFLVSDMADAITGHNLVVDEGFTL